MTASYLVSVLLYGIRVDIRDQGLEDVAAADVVPSPKWLMVVLQITRH